MFKFRIAVFSVLIAALSTTPATAKDHDKDRDDDHAKDVKVVNTPKVKVVDTPNVNVVNTPSVNVGTLPAVQLVPGAVVGIAGTPSVQIANSPATPVPVRDASRPNRTPFQKAVCIQIPEGFENGAEFVDVPAGKRLVIEYASAAGFAPIGQKVIFSFITETDDAIHPTVNTQHYLLSTPYGTFGNADAFLVGQVVKLFADPGTSLELFASRSDSTGAANVSFSISGYFEDAQ